MLNIFLSKEILKNTLLQLGQTAIIAPSFLISSSITIAIKPISAAKIENQNNLKSICYENEDCRKSYINELVDQNIKKENIKELVEIGGIANNRIYELNEDTLEITKNKTLFASGQISKNAFVSSSSGSQIKPEKRLPNSKSIKLDDNFSNALRELTQLGPKVISDLLPNDILPRKEKLLNASESKEILNQILRSSFIDTSELEEKSVSNSPELELEIIDEDLIVDNVVNDLLILEENIDNFFALFQTVHRILPNEANTNELNHVTQIRANNLIFEKPDNKLEQSPTVIDKGDLLAFGFNGNQTIVANNLKLGEIGQHTVITVFKSNDISVEKKIIGIGNNQGVNAVLSEHAINNESFISLYDDQQNINLDIAPTVLLDYTHVAITTYDGQEYTTYFDSTPIITTSSLLDRSTGRITLGCGYKCSNNIKFSGEIYEVTIIPESISEKQALDISGYLEEYYRE